MVAVVALSLTPASELPSFNVSDKVEHAVAYALLALLGAAGYRGRPRSAFFVGAGLVLLGGALEAAQAMVPGRLPDPADAVANTIGTFLGLGLVALVTRQSRRSRT